MLGKHSSVWNISAAPSGKDILYTWTRTGDLDGGTRNDTLSFDLRLRAFTGSSYRAPHVTLGKRYDLGADWDSAAAKTTLNQHFGPGDDLDMNQSFQLSIENIKFVQGESWGWDATFNGFSAISRFGREKSLFYFGVKKAETIRSKGNGSSGYSGPVNKLTVTATTNANRFRDLYFAFTTAKAGQKSPATAKVVSPSSTTEEAGSSALIGMGDLTLKLRNRN